MLGKYRIAFAVALLLLGTLPGCNSNLDDPTSAPVVLEVQNVTIPPVTASFDAITNTCKVTLTNATATVKNVPKNQFAATSPFNDIIMSGVTVTYVWDDGQGATGPVFYGITGVIPANATGSIQFSVVSFGDLNSGPGGRFGHTASMVLTFSGVLVEGAAVSVTTGGVLPVGSCS